MRSDLGRGGLKAKVGRVSWELDLGPCRQGSDGLAQGRLWLWEGEVWELCGETKGGKEEPRPTPRSPAWAREALGGHDGAWLLEPASRTLCPSC